MLHYIKFLIVLTSLCLQTSTTRAGVIISIGSVSIDPGQTEAIDVVVRSDGNDNLQAIALQIALASSASGSIMFGQPNTEHLSDSNYVFFGDSTALANMGAFDFLSTSVFLNDTYNGADITSSSSDVLLSTDNKLLTRFYVTAFVGATPGAYVLNLNVDTTTFYDKDANVVEIFVPVGGIFGTVTVNALAVPEPSSVVCLGFLGFLSCFLPLARFSDQRSSSKHGWSSRDRLERWKLSTESS